MGVGLRVLLLVGVAPYDIAALSGVASGHIVVVAGVVLRDTVPLLEVASVRMGLAVPCTVIAAALSYVAP